jgi:hypothetical protein
MEDYKQFLENKEEGLQLQINLNSMILWLQIGLPKITNLLILVSKFLYLKI